MSADPKPAAATGAEAADAAAFQTDDALIRKALSSAPSPAKPGALGNALTFGWRGMLKIKHVPEQLLDVTLTPVMFTLMFTFLFGGAIAGSTDAYLQYILPGLLVMSVLFTTVYSGISLNTDLTRGVVDRFRSLPIWRPAPLLGALLGDSVRYVVAGTVIVVLGVVLGYDPSNGIVGVLGAMGLVTLFAFALSWAFTTLGLLMRSPNAVMNAGLHADLPAHVPLERVRRSGDAAGRARVVRRPQPDLVPLRLLPRADGRDRRRQRPDDRAGHGGAADGGVRADHHPSLQPRLSRAPSRGHREVRWARREAPTRTLPRRAAGRSRRRRRRGGRARRRCRGGPCG